MIPTTNEVNYYPCKPNQKNTYTELVTFDTSSCLPRYLVELRPTLLKPPVIQPFNQTENPFISTQTQQQAVQRPTYNQQLIYQQNPFYNQLPSNQPTIQPPPYNQVNTNFRNQINARAQPFASSPNPFISNENQRVIKPATSSQIMPRNINSPSNPIEPVSTSLIQPFGSMSIFEDNEPAFGTASGNPFNHPSDYSGSLQPTLNQPAYGPYQGNAQLEQIKQQKILAEQESQNKDKTINFKEKDLQLQSQKIV